MVSSFLSHKKYNGRMKLDLKDTLLFKTNLLQNLSAICMTEVIKEFCAKSCFKTTTKKDF